MFIEAFMCTVAMDTGVIGVHNTVKLFTLAVWVPVLCCCDLNPGHWHHGRQH